MSRNHIHVTNNVELSPEMLEACRETDKDCDIYQVLLAMYKFRRSAPRNRASGADVKRHYPGH